MAFFPAFSWLFDKIDPKDAEKVAHSLSGLPLFGKFFAMEDECLKQRLGMKDANKFFSMGWLHKLALPIAAVAGILAEVYTLRTYGPIPSALFSGPIVLGVVYYLVDGLACAIEGKNFFLCPLGNLVDIADIIVKKVTGIDPLILQKWGLSIEKSVLEKSFGCKLPNDQSST